MYLYLPRNAVSAGSASTAFVTHTIGTNFTMHCEREQWSRYIWMTTTEIVAYKMKYIEQQVDSLISLNSIARVHWISRVDCAHNTHVSMLYSKQCGLCCITYRQNMHCLLHFLQIHFWCCAVADETGRYRCVCKWFTYTYSPQLR